MSVYDSTVSSGFRQLTAAINSVASAIRSHAERPVINYSVVVHANGTDDPEKLAERVIKRLQEKAEDEQV